MNQIAWQIFGGSKSKANTFIGGVASTITTSGALATKLGIASNRITNFKIVGSDVECSISGSYVLQGFYQDTNITSYIDSDGLVTDLAENVFRETTKIKELNFKGIVTLNGGYVDRNSQIQLVYLKNCTSILGQFYNDTYPSKKVFYIPAVTTLGATSGYNSVFYNGLTSAGCTIYAHPSLQTSNGGAPDGDLAFAISNGATVRYVTNFTAPSPITNLSAGFVYGTAVQLNFTAPSSTNSIDYYEVWQNGVNTGKRITASGEYVLGLTLNTAYTFQLIPVDIFYNKSTSNTVSATTVTSSVPTTGLVSYYKLDSNSNDNWGSNNGTDTSVSYVAGKIGDAASFNGTTSKITANFAGAISTAASISFWVKLVNHTPSDSFKTGILNITNEPSNSHYPFSDGNIYCGFFTNSRKTIGAGIVSDRTQWHMVTVTANSISNVWKFYQNGTLVTTSTVGSFTMLSSGTLGKSLTTYFLNGLLDEVAIYNTALTQTEIDLLYSSGQGTTL
jgi:hypothetical protein